MMIHVRGLTMKIQTVNLQLMLSCHSHCSAVPPSATAVATAHCLRGFFLLPCLSPCLAVSLCGWCGLSGLSASACLPAVLLLLSALLLLRFCTPPGLLVLHVGTAVIRVHVSHTGCEAVMIHVRGFTMKILTVNLLLMLSLAPSASDVASC